MLGYERRERIRQLISARRGVSVAELSDLLEVTPSTIRRDLERLQEQGLVQRRHGGAVPPPATVAAPEPPILERVAEQAEEKRRIGAAAAALVQDGETVFVSGGSTTLEVARNLRGRRELTVLTNALNIAQLLLADPDITLVVVGGLVRRSEMSLVGPLAQQAVRNLRASKVIMSVRAIHPQLGLTNDALMETSTDRAILGCAPELIVVADHTKFGRVAASYVAPAGAMSVLVTDSDAPADALAELRELGVRVIQV